MKGSLVVLVFLGACAGPQVTPPAPATDPVNWEPRPIEVGGLSALATVTDGVFSVRTAGGDHLFLPGVNIGSTVPGTQPGEQAITAEDFRRWFPRIHGLGLRSVRVYTIMPPSFYAELKAFNEAHPRSPLYLVHGAWIPEEGFRRTQDLFAVEAEFAAEIERAVGVVHGEVVLPDRPGHAHGSYTADVSPWLVAWVIGVEWDPTTTLASDRSNQGVAPHEGRFFENPEDAGPTEVWLARAMDHLASLEHERGISMPIAFVNWPTTDPLQHPDEPLDREDLAGIDANHVLPTNAWPGGSFASYHAYPYYPDFQRYEEGIAGFILDGEPDNYAGYLAKLRDHHAAAGLPVIVTEFGVPSSLGSAHHGPQGRDQGGLSEREAMRIDADLMSVIHRTGLAGGLVFAWADEWFKFTWNTIDLEVPADRRQMWSNPWTNEANFGLFAVEPGSSPVVVIDGHRNEWTSNGSQVIHESRGAVREVRAVKDEGYLYLAITTDTARPWTLGPLVIGFDVVDGGAPMLPELVDAGWPGGDHAVVISTDGTARSMVRASLDPILHQYGTGRNMIGFDLAAMAAGSSVWNTHRLIVNARLTIPTTGRELEAELIEVGVMMRGSADPADPAFDSRVTWQTEGTFTELRLPYQAVGFSDPSSLQAYKPQRDGTITTATVDRVGIAVVAEGETHVTNGYAWEPWQAVTWRERPKVGIGQLTTAIEAALATPPG